MGDDGPLVLDHLLLLPLVQPLKLLHLVLVPHLVENLFDFPFFEPVDSRVVIVVTFPLRRTSSAAFLTPPQAWRSQGFLALAIKVIEDHEDGDGVPEQLVVDEDGVDEVEGEEPEEETRYPAGELRMIFDLMQKKELRKWCLPATVPRRWRWRWGPQA